MLTSVLSRATFGLFLVLGDSISLGAGASRPQLGFSQLLTHNDATVWPTYEGRDLQTLCGASLQQVNLAVSGATAHTTLIALRRWLAARPQPAVDKHVIVTLTVGGNDLKNAVWTAMRAPHVTVAGAAAKALSATLHDLDAIVDLLEDARTFPQGVRILLANVYDPSNGREQVTTPYGVARIEGLAGALQQWDRGYAQFAAQRHIELIDVHKAFLNHGFTLTVDGAPSADSGASGESWFADPIHPNDQGHHALRLLFWHAIAGA